ncbi:MAG TPA: TonB-dependent receptor [Bryobacteraceae bacterium]|nr:TonB-dependent receptor [Bryobacteraceae bacterium]
MLRCLRSHLTILPALVLFAGAIFGQSSSGTISGRVLDSSGSAVAGAEVHVINQVDRSIRSYVTNASGDFVFPDLEPGTYTLSAKSPGFKQFEKKDLHLASSDRMAVPDVHLEIGAVNEVVEVVASGAQVQTASAERSGLLDSRQINDLMSRGRDVMSLLQILPGVVDDATGGDTLGAFTTPTMQGVRQQYNALNIDGISGNTARGSNAQAPINMDAIAEVKVLMNSYPAEYGTASGGVINLVTKSGTQHFHGGGYYYNRNEAMNANDFFNNRQGIARQRYRFNTVGYNVGGPIYWPNHFNASKQKLFFFFSQEILPNQKPNSVSNFVVPTALERQGIFSRTIKDPTNGGVPFGNNAIPKSLINTDSAKLLSIFPLPNAVDPKGAFNFQIAGTEDLPAQQEILKVDYNMSEKARWWFRASGFSSDNTGRTSPAISNQWGIANVDYRQTMPNLGVNFTYVFSPTLINEVTVGMNLWTESQVLSPKDLSNLQRATYGINIPQIYPKNNPLGLLPAMSFGGITSAAAISYDGRFPMVDDATAYTLSDGLSKVWNIHLFKVGVHLEHILYNQYHQAGGNSFPGSFAFGTDSNNPLDTGYAYANAMLGFFSTYNERTNRVNYAPITRIAEWYAQDTWKVTRRLTADIGFRFTWALPQTPNNNNAGNFVPYTFNPAQAPVLFRPVLQNGKKVTINPLTGEVVLPVYAGLIVPGTGNPLNGIVTPTTPGFPASMVFDNGILVGPRLGLAWDVFGDGKMAIRAGGGIFYNPRADAGTLGNLFFNPPAIYDPTQFYGSVGSVVNGTGLLSPSSFSRDIDPRAKTVTSYQFNFGIQREIGWGTVVDVAYVASLGRHLGENVQINTVPFGAQFLPQNQNPQTNTPLNDNYFRPYPGYGTIPQQIFEGNSSYHSLQVTANRRFAKSLEFGVAFTHSKAMDYAEGDSTTSASGTTNTVPTYLNRVFRNYGLGVYDRPNVLTFHFLYDLPKLSKLLPNRVVRAVADGWQIADITSFIPGKPLSITMNNSPSVNFTGGGDGAVPVLLGDPTGQRTFDQYFNVAALAKPIPVSPASCTASGCSPMTYLNFGNTPRYPIRGPGTNNWNLSVFKNFSIREKVHFQFRAEAYNAFNHTQFDGVDTTVTFNAAGQQTRASSGQLNSSRDPRIMQLALRLSF